MMETAIKRLMACARDTLCAIARSLEPHRWPDGEPEAILRGWGWPDAMIETLHGRAVCLRIAMDKIGCALWDAVFKKGDGA